MPFKVTIDKAGGDLTSFLLQDFTPAGRSRALAEVAADELDDARRVNRAALGRETPYTQTVDGARGVALQRVRPDGVIAFDFDLGEGVVEYIEELLVQHSPVLRGTYQRSHMLLADDAEVQFGATVPIAGRYTFLNTVPYSNKVERWHSVFQVVAAMAGQRFGNSTSIKFTYVTAPQVEGRTPAIIVRP